MSDLSSMCPNCGNAYDEKATYCPSCGHNKRNIQFASDSPKRNGGLLGFPPYSWKMILAALLLIPLSSCGGCLLLTTASPSFGGSTFLVWALIELISIVTGVVLLLANGYWAITNRRK